MGGGRRDKNSTAVHKAQKYGQNIRGEGRL